MSETKFWEAKSLKEMTRAEWESLCNGCARCCLHKLEDEADGEVYYTGVVCRYLDEGACQCTQYERRNELVPNCVWLTPDTAESFAWLPSTCAYRTLAERRPLADWHPLVSGDPMSVHRAGISVQGKCVSETHVPEDAFEDYIIRWVEH